MITELQPNDFRGALPLYAAGGACFPLALAVLEGGQRGQVFADRRDAPRAAFVVNNFGFALLVGESDAEFDADLARLFETCATLLRPTYLLWYAPPERWQRRLDALGAERARRRGRLRLQLDGARAPYVNSPVPCPEGFELKRLDAAMLPQTDRFGLQIGSRFWSSPEDFLERGLGVCLVGDKGEIACVCYAAAVAGGFAEVDVVTDERFRGRGLATVAAQEFVRECIARGLAPTWDCFDYNAGSLRLAERLGFVVESSYPFYSFNVPVSFAQTAG